MLIVLGKSKCFRAGLNSYFLNEVNQLEHIINICLPLLQGSDNVKRFLKKFFIICTLLTTLLYVYHGWWRSDSYTTFGHVKNNGSLTILLWHWPFVQSYVLEGDVCWDLFHIPHCKLVDDRSYFSSADIVVFHNRELIQGRQKLPTDLLRPEGQRWAWMSLESPAHNGNLKPFANIFNMTISYRRDADVTIPYGELLPKEEETPLPEDITVNKSSLVCWVVSNYMRHHKRTQVYKELSAVVPVQVYGRWTGKPLSSSDLLPTISRCFFYLAFENSLAKDYITEKLWKNSYEAGAVPVVLGPSIQDYKAVAPPHSFIHVNEFASVRELGEYLQELAKDKKRYAEYFNWKQWWKVKLYVDWRERLCNICSQNSTLQYKKTYSDLEAWDKKV
ncbi:alpha3-fucosyltransferase [Oryzias latipes]|uniref:Fucosyltransferase n=1 Tax=Oryzias latipes TaxID=8090 RepID=Q5F2P1_ORYLA|nr:fucosyltransferase 7 (alpha (1,3) fucosyltransferase) [Oryzias latipes]CAI52068.1 alpha3-fucosyltransferase [Oryzias latipes]